MMIGPKTGVPDRSQEQAPHTKVKPISIRGNGDGEGDPMESMKQFMMPAGGGKAEYVGWGTPVNDNSFFSTGEPNLAEFGAIGGQPKGKK
jgi:hypothetical protein